MDAISYQWCTSRSSWHVTAAVVDIRYVYIQTFDTWMDPKCSTIHSDIVSEPFHSGIMIVLEPVRRRASQVAWGQTNSCCSRYRHRPFIYERASWIPYHINDKEVGSVGVTVTCRVLCGLLTDSGMRRRSYRQTCISTIGTWGHEPFQTDISQEFSRREMRANKEFSTMNQSGSCTLRPPRFVLAPFPLHRRQLSSNTTPSPLSSITTKTLTSKGLAWRLNKPPCNSANRRQISSDVTSSRLPSTATQT